MKVRDMAALYAESLRDLYSAETQLIEALPSMMEAAESSRLRTAFKDHLEQTRDQAARLSTIIHELGEEPAGHKCRAMEGLIREAEELVRDVTDQHVLDAGLIGAAQKVEHYEISGYGTARTFARLLGHEDHADMLQKTLDEERAADEKLGELAETMINQAAMPKGREMAGGTLK